MTTPRHTLVQAHTITGCIGAIIATIGAFTWWPAAATGGGVLFLAVVALVDMLLIQRQGGPRP